jgi:hypothetical protein
VSPETPPRQSGSEPAGGHAGGRTRLLFAAGALGAFAILIGIVVLATGGDEPPPADPAPEACIEKWNADEDALSDGRHASGFHGYSRTQVAYVSKRGAVIGPSPAAGAGCAVIFASNGLDSEPDYAVRALQGDRWGGINTTVAAATLADLQAGAFNGANATLETNGELSAGAPDDG